MRGVRIRCCLVYQKKITLNDTWNNKVSNRELNRSIFSSTLGVAWSNNERQFHINMNLHCYVYLKRCNFRKVCMLSYWLKCVRNSAIGLREVTDAPRTVPKFNNKESFLIESIVTSGYSKWLLSYSGSVATMLFVPCYSLQDIT